ncbi:hypothetical protein LOZ61_004910 [Ophidiomyces ophidiicola]|nr:hypothetical protein LOZ61_004910 [Ophidiomyces ophidiicola]KAI1924875.1 hypothetical protein LOZ60_004475 [Ophidiomyces ophidiicola]KAI1966166.1 hypothetical protein LOZ59_000983 [Ophidiomyces ophidiicola]KAI1976285.1 hypothetical protein LOZ56_000020 [Ophidiomyces ophidiicola]KAI2097674.1 hypothetical protein LOZ33_003215 [Ophidiomyces ophidiicola]
MVGENLRSEDVTDIAENNDYLKDKLGAKGWSKRFWLNQQPFEVRLITPQQSSYGSEVKLEP